MRSALLALLAVTAAAVAASAGPAASDPSASAPPLIGAGAVGEGHNNPDLMPPTVGELRIALLFIDFPNAPGRSAPKTSADLVFPALQDWYRTVSYGRLRIEALLVPHWVTLKHESAYYRGEQITDAIREAVAAVDAEVDFSDVDAVYATPSAGEDVVGIGIVSKPLIADGRAIRAVGWNVLGNLIHETGHILGLPDLYVTGAAWSFYRWDVMAGGSRPSGLYAWHRWKLGWLDPAQIACLRGAGRVQATVTPLEQRGGVKAIVVRAEQKAYVAEVRQKLAEDATICKTGVLVYEVDLSGVRRPIWLRPARGDGSANTGACGSRWRAPFDIGRGEISRVTIGGVRFELLQKLADGSYRIRATKRR
jgi:M6 family metalloprotease-like protein